jgi:hypothetical protein
MRLTREARQTELSQHAMTSSQYDDTWLVYDFLPTLYINYA